MEFVNLSDVLSTAVRLTRKNISWTVLSKQDNWNACIRLESTFNVEKHANNSLKNHFNLYQTKLFEFQNSYNAIKL